MRRIILILAVGILIYLYRRLRASAGLSGKDSGGGSLGEGRRMVRDRVCNTFVPVDSALTVRRGGSLHYFCSERCRERFLAEPAT